MAVRVRFAPSPTGQLHLGGFRTALFNFLFARQNPGGKFLIRIEDTDRTRLVPGAEQKLIDVLNWAGITADENPVRQSDRLHFYKSASNQLLSSDRAYRCFCTERRLDLLRKESSRMKLQNRYDGRCRKLPQSKIQQLLSSQTPFTVRFKLNQDDHNENNNTNEVQFDDAVMGFQRVELGSIAESDPIIMKSDGFPTYHLANVVDDHLMDITHVLRGVEWLVSTPKHLALYRALGFEPPKFAHLPLLVNSDGAKLSKRQGDVHVEDFRMKGYYPESVMNFITTSGGGFGFSGNVNSDKLYSMEELINDFDLGRVSTHPGQLDLNHLRQFNRLAIKRKMQIPQHRVQILNDLHKIVEENFDADFGEKVLNYTQDRISTLNDLGPRGEFGFVWFDPDSTQVRLKDKLGFKDAVRIIEESDEITDNLRSLCQEKGFKLASLMKNLRLAMTGSEKGPPIAEIVQIIGKNSAVRRIKKFM